MIRIEYLAHSSFLLTCGSKRIVLDPWLSGTAYFKQWYLWPVYPGDTPKDFDAILISHGHEDHLHTATLRELNKSAKVFFPFQWRAGIKPFLNSMGYKSVTEAVSFSSYWLDDVKITYLGYSLESIVVIEYKDEVVVNINDALNSNHHNVVNYLLYEIKKRWPKIDYLLQGWSGAGYFPNQVRYPGKDDIEIGKLREQYFANNFCLFTKELNPKYSIPFVTGFVLLRESTKWINHVKFPRRKLPEYYTEHYGESSINFLVPYPGDKIVDGQLEKLSPMHQYTEDEVYNLAYDHYHEAFKTADTIHYLPESDVNTLQETLTYWLNYNAQLYDKVVLEDALFSIEMEDVTKNPYFHIRYLNGKFEVSRHAETMEDRRLHMRTSAAKIQYSLKKIWGGDAIIIGYGHEVELYTEDSLEKNLDIVCTRLITRYPMAHKDLRKFPFRAAKYYLTNLGISSLWIKQKITLKPYVNKFPFNERDHWFTYSKCDLCKVCKMPEVDNSTYNNYNLGFS